MAPEKIPRAEYRASENLRGLGASDTNGGSANHRVSSKIGGKIHEDSRDHERGGTPWRRRYASGAPTGATTRARRGRFEGGSCFHLRHRRQGPAPHTPGTARRGIYHGP